MKNTNIKMILATAVILFAGAAFANDNLDISKVNAYVIQPALRNLNYPGVPKVPGYTHEQICNLVEMASEGLASLSKSYSDEQIAAIELFDLIGEDFETNAADIRHLRTELAAKTQACNK